MRSNNHWKIREHALRNSPPWIIHRMIRSHWWSWAWNTSLCVLASWMWPPNRTASVCPAIPRDSSWSSSTDGISQQPQKSPHSAAVQFKWHVSLLHCLIARITDIVHVYHPKVREDRIWCRPTSQIKDSKQVYSWVESARDRLAGHRSKRPSLRSRGKLLPSKRVAEASNKNLDTPLFLCARVKGRFNLLMRMMALKETFEWIPRRRRAP